MCHPEKEPEIDVPEDGFKVFVNRTEGYGNGVKSAIGTAIMEKKDLVLADSDGYHPASEIAKLAKFDIDHDSALVKPYRQGIGFQSGAYSFLYSMVKEKRIWDATGGLYRLTNDFMGSMPSLKSKDMTINVEILNAALMTDTPVIQYGYTPGTNDRKNSKRTAHYQLKLLKAMLA